MYFSLCMYEFTIHNYKYIHNRNKIFNFLIRKSKEFYEMCEL